MTDEAMDLQKEHELDRILSTLYDDGVSAQELERLESLLSGNTSLQDRYWQFVSTHVALSVAGGVARDVDAPRPSNDSSLLDLVSKEPRSRRSRPELYKETLPSGKWNGAVPSQTSTDRASLLRQPVSIHLPGILTYRYTEHWLRIIAEKAVEYRDTPTKF